MKPFDSSYFVWMAHHLTHIAQYGGPAVAVHSVNPDEVAGTLETMASRCTEGGLPLSADLLRNLKEKVLRDRERFTYGHLSLFVYEFQRGLVAEMKRVLFVRLEEDEPAYFEGNKPSWGDAVSIFPEVRDEITEGGKCFALGRHPAAVFHMMRVLEVGLNALAHELGVAFEHKNWQNIIDEIEKQVRAIPSSDPGRKAKEHFYSSAAIHFRFLKDAWRNYVMHVKEPQTHETALMVVLNVSAFMRQLASDRPWLKP